VIDDTLYDAFGQRQITQYFSQCEFLSPDPRGDAGQVDKVDTLNKLYVKSSTGQAVAAVHFREVTTTPVQPLSISHQSQFPAVTISFNLAQARPRTGGRRDRRCGTADGRCRSPYKGRSRARRRRSSRRVHPAVPDPAALITVYIILGILYESYILPLTILFHPALAGVGALLMLMVMKYDLSVIALIA